MLWGFQQLETKIPFLTNYPRVIGIQQELWFGEADGSNREPPKPPNPHLNPVDNSQLIVELTLFNVILQIEKDFAMNKGELVDAVAEKASVTKKQADAVLSAALEAIMEAVSDGDKVTLVGFGSFESRERKAREGRNPKTGDKMEIPATRVPAFSAGKLFKDRVAPPKNAE